MARMIDAVQVLHDINLHHRPTPVSEFESGFNDGLNQAMWEITRAPTLTQPNEWVSVEERLPEEKQRVIVRCERVGTSVGWILWSNWMTDIGPGAGKVTHWMELPAPPGKDNNVPTKAQNEPLTLDELREMDGEPVYVVPKDKPAHCGGWCGVTVWKCDRYSYVSLLRDADSGWGFEKYGKTWNAYRRPPEGEEET